MGSDEELEELSEILSPSQSVTTDETTKKSNKRKMLEMDQDFEISSQSQSLPVEYVKMNNPTSEQMDALLSFLGRHQDLARGRLRNVEGRCRAKFLWDKITNRLNGLEGGCVKSVKQWQRIWSDKKYLAKKAAAGLSTGCSTSVSGQLSPQELQIISIIEQDGYSQRPNKRKTRNEIDSGDELEDLSGDGDDISSPSPVNGERIIMKTNKRIKVNDENSDHEQNQEEIQILPQAQILTVEGNVPMSSIPTTEQMDVLLTFLEEHRDLARGKLRTTEGRTRAKFLWDKLTKKLNTLGGCVKNVKQWQKVWTDKKYLAKKAASLGTDSDPAASVQLSSQELRIISIIGDDVGQTEPDNIAPVYILLKDNEQVQRIGISRQSSPAVSLSLSPAPELRETKPVLTSQRRHSDDASECSRTSSEPQRRSEETMNQRLLNLEERRLEIESQQGRELSHIRAELTLLRVAVQDLVEVFKNKRR